MNFYEGSISDHDLFTLIALRSNNMTSEFIVDIGNFGLRNAKKQGFAKRQIQNRFLMSFL
ncbi:hypothetical protein GCM10027566_09140 [Arachidicoccus ginsenosidivorans]|jgi:hypothetical protein